MSTQSFHEARDVRIENPDAPQMVHRWIATHNQCGSELLLSDGQWHCGECEIQFQDDHAVDVAAEERDRAARNASSHLFATGKPFDAAKATKELEQERASIKETVLKKRESLLGERKAHGDVLLKDITSRIDDASTHTELAAAIIDARHFIPSHSDFDHVRESVSGSAEKKATEIQAQADEAAAWSDVIALIESTIARLDIGSADELTVRKMFDGGDHGDGAGDSAAGFLSVEGAHDAFAKAREVPSPTWEAKARTLVDDAIIRGAERDAEKAAREAEARRAAEDAATDAAAAAEDAAAEEAAVETARIEEEEAAAHRKAQAELDAVATESAGSGGEPGEARATTEPPPPEPEAETANPNATDDKPRPTE